MIANQTKGKGFGGVLTYLLSKEKSQIIGGNMIGENVKELSTEFKKSRELRPNLKNCVWHASLSLPHDETLTDEKWSKLGNEYATKMGFKDSQFVIVRHHDTEHEHIHIVASRISLNGNVVSDSQDYKRSEKVVRGLEKHFGLTPTLSSHEIGRSAPTKGELFKAIREQKPSTKSLLQAVIDDVTKDRPDAMKFINKLQDHGIEVIPNVAKTGHISGISFVHEGEKMKGSDLGRDYTWSKLCKRRIIYERSNINIRNFITAQQEQNFRDFSGRSNRTDTKVQNRIHTEDSQRIRADILGDKEDQGRNQKRTNRNWPLSTRNQSKHGHSQNGIGENEKMLETSKSHSSVLRSLLNGDRDREVNGISDLEDVLKNHRKKKQLRKKPRSKDKDRGIDFDF